MIEQPTPVRVCIAVVLSALFVAFGVAPASVAAPQERLTDAQLMERLPGTWEMKASGDRTFPFTRALATFHRDQRFQVVLLGSLLGSPVRAEAAGRWRIERNNLIQEAIETNPPMETRPIQRMKIVSLNSEVLIVRSAETVEEARRCVLPRSLPPLITNSVTLLSEPFRRQAGLSMPTPRYPLASLQHKRQGVGHFVLMCDSGGKVTSVQIAKGTGSLDLDAAAVGAFREWRFKPGSFKKGLLSMDFTLR